ncbi:hypothetical protein GH5_08449 [Leishmania sp. Ghana 2012 LV757]|uniref:hypothetical protein n=1 Tax=Leishmania sp. Ghana 2012 LV757 TaxID=2803181 RepID=UPI001B4BB5A9|nr:hypothetical protein GH5_08449 [Leishmania sp. Ghana 2012 LV757]
MAVTKQLYYDCVERTLLAAMCLQSFASDVTEGCAVPAVELMPPDTVTDSSPTASLAHPHFAASAMRSNSLRLQWSSGDECLIEGSYNSTRLSFWFAAAHQPGDALSIQLLNEYVGFFCSHGAATGALPILRRAPVEYNCAGEPAAHTAGPTAYDVSFLVLAEHVHRYGRHHLARFIMTFIKEAEAAIADLKVSLNARRRAAAKSFFALPP